MGRREWIQFFVIIGIAALVFFAILEYKKSQDKTFSITFFNVGQGDSALIKFRDGKKMLVDCGISGAVVSRLSRGLSFFDRQIDVLLVTHPDNDHYGGCIDVLRRYNVKTVVENGMDKSSDPYWQEWQRYIKEEGSEHEVINDQEEWRYEKTALQFLAPDESLGLDEAKTDGNNRSIVFTLRDPSFSVLFTGDMEGPLESALLNKYCSSTPQNCPTLDVDYLKIGHHGSDSSSSEEFLSAVSPKTAIISVGQNKYGHPSLRTLRRLERVGAEIWRTDEKSDIIIKE